MESQVSFRDVEGPTSSLWLLACARETFLVASTLCLPFILTYLVTRWRFGIVLRSKKKGKEPPTLPYMIPVLGHAVPFAWNTRRAISTITYAFSAQRLPSTVDLPVHAEVL